MKVFKFIPPYTADGKTKFPDRGKTGVYLIKENGKIVYIGYSLNDLYKTMYRHFQTWNHTGQEVVSYNAKGSDTYTVRVVYCTPSQADRLERYLIRKHKPRDNRQTYELNFADKKTGQAYENEEPQTPKFTAAELKVQEEDKAYFEELERGGAAIFGNYYERGNTGKQEKLRSIIISRGEKYSLMYGVIVPTEEALKEVKKRFSELKLVIDTEDTLFYREK